MNRERCLVLGGAGFMGSALVELLLKEGASVRVFDQKACPAHWTPPGGVVEMVRGSFMDSELVAEAVSGCQYVVHLIGTTVPATSSRDPVFDVQTNLVGTLGLLETCVRAKVRQILFSSSGGTIYGEASSLPIPETHPTEPRSSYGITKLAIEKYLTLFSQLHGLDYTVLRVANAYGPGLPLTGEQGVIGVFLARLKEGRPIVLWGDDSVVRDYVYIDDVAQAFRAAVGQRSPCRIFNIGTGVGTSLLRLITLMERITGLHAKIEKHPDRSGVSANVLDPRQAQQHLGWKAATSLEKGLTLTWEWIRTTNP
ncbi:MAG: NAD-dependent epimerase/dehydratase family protein [Acidobacteria bacterium]|nr:NAD-dependent epimerase/dehydratase family protein [Acidobacteriota bacterium]